MKNVTLILLLCLPIISKGQIWIEEFSAAVANGSTSRTGATAWSTTQPTGTATTKKFSKQTPAAGYELFEVNDTGAASEGVWTSELINITSYTEVALEVTLYSYFTFSTDYIRCYYKINGGSEILFGELLGSNGLNITSAASALVAGGPGVKIQIVIRAKENTSGTTSGVDNALAFDDVTVSNIDVLYSIVNNGNWNNTATWSKGGFSGTTCGCLPDDNSRVVIGNNKNVNLNVAGTTAGITVQNTGKLTWNANNLAMTMARGGTISIETGGVITKGSATGSSILYDAYIYTINVNQTFSIDDINFNPGASVTFTGSGTTTVNNLNLSIGNGRTITNSMTGNLVVTNRIYYNGNNMAFVNNGTLTSNANGIVVAAAANNGNTFTNSSGASFSLSSFTLNNADFTVSNNGTITQSGDFTTVDAGSAFNNLTGSTWNFGGTTIANVRLFCNSGSNSFNYNRAGAQTIITPQSSGTYSNLSLSSSGLKTIGAALDINGDLSIGGTAQLDVSTSNYAILLGGNWTVSSANADPFVQRSGQVTFDGTTNQTLTTSLTTETFYNLVINKASGNVVMSNSPGNNTTVTNVLTLTSGGLDINGRTLFITSSSTSAIARTNGFVKSETTASPYSQLNWAIGNVSSGSYVFPFGKTSATADYIPFTFTVTTAGTSLGGTLSVSTYPTAVNNTPYPSGVTNVNRFGSNNSSNVVDRFWIITPVSYITNPTATLTFVATTAEVGSIAVLRVQHWSTKWDEPIAGQNNPTATSARVPAVNDFSPWTMSGNSAPLPVALVYFKAQQEDNHVLTHWLTAQEFNNDFFTIEKTVDLKAIVEVGRVTGQGTTKESHEYSTVDNDPYVGISYYRLKQTDFDGHFVYSGWVEIKYTGLYNSTTELLAYPNPFDGNHITIELKQAGEKTSLPVQFYDMRGHKIVDMVFSSETTGLLKQDVFFDQSLPKGIYFIKAGDALQFTKKVIVE